MGILYSAGKLSPEKTAEVENKPPLGLEIAISMSPNVAVAS